MSIEAMSTTVEGIPVSAPPSIARSAPATISSGTSSKPRRRRLAAEVGRGLEHRAHDAGERAVEQADAEAGRVLAAGERIAVLGVVEDQGDGPRQQRADGVAGAGAEPSTSSRIASGEK